MNKKKLEDKIKLAQDAYYNGISIITDDEYDALVYELSSLDPNNKVLTSIGAEVTNKEWVKEKHPYPLGSLNKVNYPEEMSKWISENLKSKEVLVTEKLDGLSIGCKFDDGELVSACLRGNGIEGENILSNVIKMKGVVKKVPGFNGVVRGEIILKNSDHKKYLSTYSNPRNAASGICRSLEGIGCEHLTLIFYDVLGNDDFATEIDLFKFLENNGFMVPNYNLCKTTKEVNDIWKKYQDSIRDSLDYQIDGLVVYCNDIAYGKSLGETNLKPKSKMAFKFANQFVKTKVNNITFQVGASGRVTPICWFDKVNLLGSNIEKASVYNISYINQLKLDIGAEILVCKANEVIPRVEKVVKDTGTIAKAPIHCPECSHFLVTEGEYILCPNIDSCPKQMTGRIENWVNQLNLLEWGTTLISRLVEEGLVKNIYDLYRLTPDQLSNIDRMGKKSADKCLKILWDNSEISLENFLGGLSIPMVGASVIKMVINGGYDTLDLIQSATMKQLEAVNGLGPAKAESLYKGLIKNKELIDKLLLIGVNIKEKPTGKLVGKSFAITGTLSMKRADIERMIEDNGGIVKSSVSKDTSFLIINDTNSASSKAVNAKKNGVKLISENDLLAML